MKAKLPRKLLSCLLALAICITTVLGCLMTVSAQTATYAFGEATVNDDLTQAAISLTFTPPADYLDGGAYSGQFTLLEVDKKADNFLVLEGIKSADESIVVTTSTEGITDNELAYVMFDKGSEISTVTLELTFTFSGGAAKKGRDYKVSLADVVYTGRYGGTYSDTATGVYGTIKTGCDHIVTVDEESLVKTDSVNGYSVYSASVCSVCGDPLGMQVVPTKTPGKVIYWDGTYHSDAASLADVLSGSGTEANPYIIDSADDLSLVVKGKFSSEGVYFKVADGIDAIVLQPESVGKGIISLNSAAAVKNYFEDPNITSQLKTWTNNGWSAGEQFKGTFDGNGVTVYGLYYNNPNGDHTVGLFGSAQGYTVKNLTVKNSYIQVLTLVGAIIGCQRDTTGTLSQCAVANCYIRHHMSENTTNTATTKAAVMVNNASGAITLNNCMVYGNDARNVGFTNAAEDCVGYPLTLFSNNSASNVISNVVSLGVVPYAKYAASWNGLCDESAASVFNNVYTDQPVTDLYNYQLKDSKIQQYNPINANVCAKFTSTTAAKVKTQEFVDNLNANADGDVWQLDAVTGYPTFTQDVAKIDSENVVYLDSQLSADYTPTFITEAAEGVGNSEDNPYIIDNITDLYGLVKIATYAQTKDKYFKLSDDLDILVLQKSAYIKTLGDGDLEAGLNKLKNMTADEAEEYLSTVSDNRQTWWNGSINKDSAGTFLETSNVFAGTIDFNGVEIYGMYNTGGALFRYVNDASFKNLTVKSSYVISDAAAVIASSGSYGGNDGIINIENCTVANNAVVCQRKNNAIGNAGVMFAEMGDNVVNVNNCLVYGNTARHQGYYGDYTGYDITYGLIGSAGFYIVDESGNIVTATGENTVNVYSGVKNSVILDCVPHGVNYAYSVATNMTFENVYTNVAGTSIVNKDFDWNDNHSYIYTVSPTIDSNGRYYPYIYKYTDGAATATGSITNYESTGSVVAAPSNLTGLAGSKVVTDLNTANGAEVWLCSVGGYPTPTAAYADKINAVSSADLQLAAYNLTYNDDGSFNLNFHYEPAYKDFAPELYVAQADLSGFMKLEAKEKSSYAGNGLADDALMYVIENLSAREIGDTMLPTIVVANGNQALWGKTEQISIADYAIDVINGKAAYTADATDEQIQQDKNVAAAVINYGEAAKKALSQGYDGVSGGKTIYWKGDQENETVDTINDEVDGVTQAGTAADPIIIDNAGELYVLQKLVGDSSKGLYYKMADGISTVILQPEALAEDVLALADAQAVRTYFEGSPSGVKRWYAAASGTTFQGNFDGNGVTFYGLYGPDSDGGLFSRGTGDVTLCNFTIRNSYRKTYGSGLVLGQMNNTATGNTATIKGVSIINNCVIGWNSTSMAMLNQSLIGSFAYTTPRLDNLLVYGNLTPFEGANDMAGNVGSIGLINSYGKNPDGAWFTNSVILGITPYRITGEYTDANGEEQIAESVTFSYMLCDAEKFSGVYTDMPTSDLTWYNSGTAYTRSYSDTQIAQIDPDNIKGSAAVSAMPNLDWSSWSYGMSGEYPTPSAAAESAAQNVSCYSGTPATSFADTVHGGTSADDAIVISSADELAYLANGADGLTAGKYYEIDPSIDAMVLQPSDYAEAIMALNTTDEVKNYFETNASSLKKWATKAAKRTYNSTQSDNDDYGKIYNFGGSLNGNGVTIYGLYANSQVAGLFPYGWNLTVENLAIKNCYTNADKAGIISSEAAQGNKDDDLAILSMQNCEITNNVLIWSRRNAAANAGGLILGSNSGEQKTWSGYGDATSDSYTYNGYGAQLENCVIYGNVVRHTDYYGSDGALYDLDGGLFGNVQNAATSYVKNSIVLDTFPGLSYASNYSSVAVAIENVFSNLVGATLTHTDHTDNGATTINYTTEIVDNGDGNVTINYKHITNGATYTTTATMTGVTADDLMGDKAVSALAELGWAENGTGVWYAGNDFTLPSLNAATGVMPEANQTAYDAITMTVYDNYAATDPEFSMYATSLNLKTNPYIAFTFAFSGEYKTNRDNITVTFTNSSGTQIAQTTVGNGNGGVSAGWTNNEGAGRYHLYRLDSVPVEDLCKPITVTVKYGDNEAVTFGTFSVEGFAIEIDNAYKKDPCQYYATRAEAAKALLYYTQMINERYGA